MPRVGEPTTTQRQRWEREQFEQGFKRSRRGNLWRNWEGWTLTIFERDDGFYGWCIATPNGPRYSHGGYDSEDDALDSLAGELGVGQL